MHNYNMETKRYETSKAERDDAVYKRYSEIMKGYGELATRISKESVYADIAIEFFVSAQTIGNIIRKKLKVCGRHRTL